MIPLVKVAMPPAEVLMPALQEILYSGMIAEGQAVYDFERLFAAKFSTPTVLAMSSGTAALHAALTLSGVGPGDDVISTPMTAEPTNTSVLYCGANVIWADVDPMSGNIDPESVRDAITPRTKAILCVHYAGYPAHLSALRAIADEYGIALIEDCAHAVGATYGGQKVGNVGDFAIFSFQAIKHFTTVDGGMLVIRNEKHVPAAKKFRWFGMIKGAPRTELDITSIGYKYNMNNVNATIGLVQLEYIDNLVAKHVANGEFFDREFGSVPGVEFARAAIGAKSSYWLYTLLSDESASVEAALLAAGCAASKLHRPNNRHSIFARAQKPLPGLEKFYARLLHIPCGWWVGEAERQTILDAIKKG